MRSLEEDGDVIIAESFSKEVIGTVGWSSIVEDSDPLAVGLFGQVVREGVASLIINWGIAFGSIVQSNQPNIEVGPL